MRRTSSSTTRGKAETWAACHSTSWEDHRSLTSGLLLQNDVAAAEVLFVDAHIHIYTYIAQDGNYEGPYGRDI